MRHGTSEISTLRNSRSQTIFKAVFRDHIMVVVICGNYRYFHIHNIARIEHILGEVEVKWINSVFEVRVLIHELVSSQDLKIYIYISKL